MVQAQHRNVVHRWLEAPPWRNRGVTREVVTRAYPLFDGVRKLRAKRGLGKCGTTSPGRRRRRSEGWRTLLSSPAEGPHLAEGRKFLLARSAVENVHLNRFRAEQIDPRLWSPCCVTAHLPRLDPISSDLGFSLISPTSPNSRGDFYISYR